MIVIVDYGMSNCGSIRNMLEHIGESAVVSSKTADIESADKLILPGVGAFDSGIRNLTQMGLVPILENKVMRGKTPILGICLGMQLFSKRSEEGALSGLGWIEAETVRFNPAERLKIPHMGWNEVVVCKRSRLFEDMCQAPRFYFVHSYHVVCANEEDILAKTSYSLEFTSAIEMENIIGVQFHPEKSHKYGMKILKNFAKAF